MHTHHVYTQVSGQSMIHTVTDLSVFYLAVVQALAVSLYIYLLMCILGNVHHVSVSLVLQADKSHSLRVFALCVQDSHSKLRSLNVAVFHPDILARGGKVEFWECEGGRRELCFDQCIFFKSQGGALRIQGGANAPPPPPPRPPPK